MDKNIVLAVIFGAAAVVGAMETVYQIYQLTVMDAAARGLKHPKLWGLLAANGNNSSGLLLYLIGRRNYPMNSIDSRQLVVNLDRNRNCVMGTGNVTFLQVSPYVQKENADIHQNALA